MMKQIINGKQYDTDTAQIVATDRYWDGSNWDRNGRTTTLYRTRKGAFFLYHETRWQGERDHLEPVSQAEAMRRFEQLPEKEMSYEQAFGIEPEEA